jgi:hypothetical protein
MAEENADDMIIQIADAIRKQFGGQQEFAVEFAELEKNWEIPAGATSTWIEAAAEDLGYEIVRKGASRATLRKNSEVYVA